MRNFLSRHTLIEQMLKFGVVGTTAFLIDTIVFWILIRVFDINSYISLAVAFAASLMYNYFLSMKWVFDPKRSNGSKTLFVFSVLSLIGLLLTEILYGIIINAFLDHISNIRFVDYYELTAKVIASFIVMVYNFITRKIFLEGKKVKN